MLFFIFSKSCDTDYMKSLSKHKIMIWVLLLVVGVSLFITYSEYTRSSVVRVIFLDVGQGDATLIVAPNGRQILIDAGKYPSISEKISVYMPNSDRSIEMVIATHPDIDHVAGFNTLLDEYSVDYFVHSGLLAGASLYKNIADKVNKYKIPNHSARTGDKIMIDKDMYLEILYPYLNKKIDNPNDYSVVVRLVYEGKSILLTGDASTLVEQDLVTMYGENIQSDILKLGHHGSKTSSSSNFIKTVNPKHAIISASCDNSFGHPHASVLQTLEDHDVPSLSTCTHGDIVFEFREGEWVLKN